MGDKKKSTLTYIQEMFKDKVDEDVINLVLTECQYNVEKTVMNLLNLTSESITNKSSVGDFSSTSHKLDDIDPVDTPLPVLPQYFSPTTKDVSEFLSKTQYSDVCFTKPIPLDDDSTPGTARPVFPNYLASENENLFGAKPFSSTVPNVQYDFKLGSGFTENEFYVSDDDIDEHIDFIDSIDPVKKIDRNDKVDYDGANHRHVKDKNTVKNVEQNVSKNVSKNKSSDHQSFLNDKIVRPNTPQPKQVSMHSGSRTFTRHPFGPQFSFPPNQASYFANQARYFPTFPRPFTQPRRNTPPMQYQRPPFPAFRPPIPHHFPPRNTNYGSKLPNQCVPATSMAADRKETGHSSPETIMADSNKRSKHSRQTCSMTSDAKGENRPPLTITATDRNKESKHPAPTSTMTNGSKRCNQPPLTSTMTYGNKGSSHPTQPSTMATGTKEPSQSELAATMGSKGPTPPIPVTTTHTSKGRSPPVPVTSTHTTKGPSPPFSVTSTATNKALSPPTQLTFTQTSKPPSHLIPTISTQGSTVLNHPKQTVSKPFGSKGSNHSAPATSMSFSNKGSNHIHKGYGHTQTRMQAKFSSYETKSLIILRGLPGSGKSTLARHLAAKGGMIISTDDYFTKGNRYSFNHEELSKAHEWNQNRAKAFMEAGFGPLVIDNTNTQGWEMRPYVLTGLKCGYKVDIKEPETWWKWNIKELERRNTHNVPAKILESMLERYEKNVTVEKIVQTAGQPITPSKSNDGGESIENTAKYKTNNKHETTSSESKPFTENGKLPKANGNLEPKKPTSKKTISLSANFASPLDRSKRSLMNKGSKKQASKANVRMNPLGNRFDVLAKSVDMNTNSDSTIRYSLPLASADVSRDKPETSGKGCVSQKDVSSETALKASLKSECSNEVTSNKGDSGLQYSLEIDTSESKSFQPGDTQGDEVHLEDISHEDNNSPSEPSASIEPGFETSVLDDKTLATKSISESSPSQQAFKEAHTLNEVKENEETYAQLDISDTLSSQQTLCHSEHLHSEGSATAKPGVKKPSNDEGTDLRSDSNAHPSPDIPDGELIESFLRKKQEVDLDNSECDNKFVNIDKEAVSPQVFSHVPVAGNAVQSINDELSLTESDTLVPNLTEYSSSISDITSQVLDESYKNVKLSVDVQSPLRKLQKSTNNSSLPSNDLHHFKVETQTATKIEPSLCVDIPMIDKEGPNIDVNNKESNSTVNVEGDQCGSNTSVLRDSNCKETQAKSSLDVFDLKTNIPDVNCRMQEHAQKSDTKLSDADMKNLNTSTHSDSSSDVQDVQDVFVSSNSDVLSGSEPDVLNTVAASVSESSGRNSDIDTTSCSSMVTVREQPIITANGFSFRSDSSTIVDRSSVKHFSHNDLEQADCNTVDSAGSKMDVNTCIKMGNPLMDGGKAKVNEAEFKITDNDVKCKDSDMLSPTASKNETLDPIQFLKDCFPHTEVDLLKSFLNSCDGDLLKTVDSLLEYNENDYQSVTSVCYDKHEESPREALGINSPESPSIPLAENSPQDQTASPNVNRARNLVLTPEHQSSFGIAEGKSPISGPTSTPRKFRDNIVQSLQLTLDPALALQLLEMFGAFSGVSAKDLLSESDRSIKVDKEFAKVLYTKWRKSVQARNKAKKAEETKKLSPGIGSPDSNTRRKFKTPLRQFYLPDAVPENPENPGKHVVPRPEPVSLKEIMDEQYAIGVCQSDQETAKRFVEEQLDLSTKLKRKRLHGMFPDVDAVALNEIFQANDYDLDTTIMQVQSSCGMPLTGQSTTVADTKEQSFANHQSSSVRQIEIEAEYSTEYGVEVVGNFQSLNDPSYQDYRAEALTHFEQRTECIKKAALAYSKKQGELAKIYADQARHHGEKMKESNRRAAEKILESRNQDLMHSNTLDLHELHVNEAIQVLHSVLEERKNERRSTPSKKLPSYLEVITGRGNRSRDGKPRIKPAVMDYLRRKGYRYEELNSGLYKVFLN